MTDYQFQLKQSQRIVSDWVEIHKSYAPAIAVKNSAEQYPHYYMPVNGVTHVDVYDILDWAGVSSAVGHAIKKLLRAGQRGGKDEIQDLTEAVDAINRRIEQLKNK